MWEKITQNGLLLSHTGFEKREVEPREECFFLSFSNLIALISTFTCEECVLQTINTSNWKSTTGDQQIFARLILVDWKKLKSSISYINCNFMLYKGTKNEYSYHLNLKRKRKFFVWCNIYSRKNVCEQAYTKHLLALLFNFLNS